MGQKQAFLGVDYVEADVDAGWEDVVPLVFLCFGKDDKLVQDG